MGKSDKKIAGAAVILLWCALQKKKAKTKRRWWTKPRVLRSPTAGLFSNLPDELEADSLDDYQAFIRMSPNAFQALLERVRGRISRQDTTMRQSISAEKRLALTLRFLATGEKYSSIKFTSRVGISTISGIIPEVCEAIYDALKDEYLKMPNTPEEWKAISDQFYQRWDYPNCCGVIDGKHVVFHPSGNEGSLYVDYKGTHSVVLLAVVDAEYRFLYIDVGRNGRVSDGVFERSTLNDLMLENSLKLPDDAILPNSDVPFPYHFISDNAFPLRHNIMKPYPLQGLTPEELVFNKRLSRARQVVDCAFRILSNRFGALLGRMHLSPKKVETIVLTVCALHNFISDNSHVEFNRGVGPAEECGLHSLQTHAPQANTNALAKRNALREYFNGVGKM